MAIAIPYSTKRSRTQALAQARLQEQLENQARFRTSALSKPHPQYTQHTEQTEQEEDSFTQKQAALESIRENARLLRKTAGKPSITKTVDTARVAFRVREAINNGDLSAFMIPFALALAKDCIIDFIPFINILFGWQISLLLIIILWGKGRFSKRLVFKWIVLPFTVLIIGNIPLISFFPIETAIVYWVYSDAKKAAEHARATLAVSGEEIANRQKEDNRHPESTFAA